VFKSLINDAKSAAGSLVARYLARASIAVPFLIGFGFAIAAVTLMLVDRFGAVAAYWMVAGGFIAIGLVAGLVVRIKEHEEEAAETQAEREDTKDVASDAMTQAAMQAPLALVGALMSTSFGSNALGGGLKTAGRNLPLVSLLAMVAFLLFWPSPEEDATQAHADSGGEDDSLEGRLRSMPPSGGNGRYHEAA